jgi:pimeloyl-ACP methyl ester carboxylesterase
MVRRPLAGDLRALLEHFDGRDATLRRVLDGRRRGRALRRDLRHRPGDEGSAGRDGPVLPHRSHDVIAASELVIIEGLPHGLVLTHAEEFNRALLDFLER